MKKMLIAAGLAVFAAPTQTWAQTAGGDPTKGGDKAMVQSAVQTQQAAGADNGQGSLQKTQQRSQDKAQVMEKGGEASDTPLQAQARVQSKKMQKVDQEIGDTKRKLEDKALSDKERKSLEKRMEKLLQKRDRLEKSEKASNSGQRTESELRSQRRSESRQGGSLGASGGSGGRGGKH